MQNRHSSQNPSLKGPDHFNNVSGFRQQDSHTNYFQKQSTTKQSSFDNVPVKIFKKSDNEAAFNNQKEFSRSAKSESKSRIEKEVIVICKIYHITNHLYFSRKMRCRSTKTGGLT